MCLVCRLLFLLFAGCLLLLACIFHMCRLLCVVCCCLLCGIGSLMFVVVACVLFGVCRRLQLCVGMCSL